MKEFKIALQPKRCGTPWRLHMLEQHKLKLKKIHVLVSQYEVFKMEEGESIKDFVQRFTALTNQLMLLGKTFDNVDLVDKVLRSLMKD